MVRHDAMIRTQPRSDLIAGKSASPKPNVREMSLCLHRRCVRDQGSADSCDPDDTCAVRMTGNRERRDYHGFWVPLPTRAPVTLI